MTGYTLIFDGNFFLHKTLVIAQKIKKGDFGSLNFIDDLEGDKNLLLWKLSIDFSSEVKRFADITDKIVYCIDSRSWRKQFIDKSYKANRVKSNDMNWSALYEIHDEFAKSLEDLGVIVSKVPQTEADDLIFGWSSYLNQQGRNALIISGDNDLLQLVNQDKSSSSNTLYYNKFSKALNVFEGFDQWLSNDEKIDMFNMPLDIHTNTKFNLQKILQRNKIETNEICTEDFVFKKILIGDSGDNVPPLYVKEKEGKDGKIRRYRVTDNQATKVLNSFKDLKIHVSQTHFFIDDLIDKIVHDSKVILKIPIDQSDLKERWLLNRNLVYLHKDCIPSEVYTDMLNEIEQKVKSRRVNVNNIKSNKILEGTTYTKKTQEKQSEASSNLFKTKDKKSDVKITKTGGEFNSDLWNDLII